MLNEHNIYLLVELLAVGVAL